MPYHLVYRLNKSSIIIICRYLLRSNHISGGRVIQEIGPHSELRTMVIERKLKWYVINCTSIESKSYGID